MKNTFKLFFSLTLNALIFSCDPPVDSNTPKPEGTPGAVTGAVTPVGTAEGDVIAAPIGPGGGTVESADKRIQISIPAGALTANQTISVQPISNNCPAGSGQAFRLMPHGITFAKPVAITFQYTDEDINGSAPELLRIAYQNEKGTWQAPVVRGLNTIDRKVTINTDHFSDWGLFQQMFIDPENSFLSPGENVRLRVSEIPASEDTEKELLIVPIPGRVDAKYVDKWTLAGEGTLKDQGNEANYFAPASIPATNPAAVTVFLNKSVTIEGKIYKDIRLVSNIYVAPEGLSVQIDGGAWTTYPGSANINTTRNVVLGNLGKDYASVAWVGAPTGTYHWTKSANVAFNLNKWKLVYAHIYGKGANISGGSVSIDNSHPTWVAGTFTVQPAGWVDTGAQIVTIGTAGIKGVFRVKRVKQPL